MKDFDVNKQLRQFLVQLGELILLGTDGVDWKSVEEATKICKRHNLTLNQKPVDAEELEAVLRKYFHDKDEIYEDGINAIVREKRVDWDLVLMLRFYHYDPEQDFRWVRLDQPLTVCQD